MECLSKEETSEIFCSFCAANDVDGGSPEILADADVDARLVEDVSTWIPGGTCRYLQEAVGHGQAPGGSQGVGRPGCQDVRVSGFRGVGIYGCQGVRVSRCHGVRI